MKRRSDSFMQSIKIIENEETKLLKLQKLYIEGRVKEEDLTEKQINDLCDLFDNQIKNLTKSNEMKKQMILKGKF